MSDAEFMKTDFHNCPCTLTILHCYRGGLDVGYTAGSLENLQQPKQRPDSRFALNRLVCTFIIANLFVRKLQARS